MKIEYKYFLYGSLISLLIWWMLLSPGCTTEYRDRELVITDTVYVDKPYKEIILKEIEVPKNIYIYKTDTIFREKLINDTLIAGIEIDRKTASIHTITPKGLPLLKQYELQPFKNLEINHQGDLSFNPKNQRRKRFWKNMERIGVFVGGVWIGSKLSNQ